jgi:hypothetical protein
MRKLHCIAAVLLVLAAPADAAQKAHAVAHLKNLEGKPVGTVDFAAVNRGVLVTSTCTICRRARMPSTCTHRAIATQSPVSPRPGRS